MTQMPTLLPNHAPTASELATITTAITRNTPLKGVLITNTASIATTSGTTEMDMSKYAMTGLTFVTNRYYMYRYNVTFTKTVASDGFDFKLRVNSALSGTQVGQSGFQPTQSTGGADWTFEFVFKGDSTYNSLYLSVFRSSGTGTFTYYGATAATPLLYRAWAELRDLGDSDNWSDVP